MEKYNCVVCKREINSLALTCPWCGTIEAGERARQAYELEQERVAASDTSYLGRFLAKLDHVSGVFVGCFALLGAVVGLIAESNSRAWGLLYAIPAAAFGAMLLGGISWAATGFCVISQQFRKGLRQKVVIIGGFVVMLVIIFYFIA